MGEEEGGDGYRGMGAASPQRQTLSVGAYHLTFGAQVLPRHSRNYCSSGRRGWDLPSLLSASGLFFLCLSAGSFLPEESEDKGRGPTLLVSFQGRKTLLIRALCRVVPNLKQLLSPSKTTLLVSQHPFLQRSPLVNSALGP